MKKVIFYLLFLAGFQTVSGQSQLAISAVDSLQTTKERNFYQDTLWVMDSSHFYNSIDYNLQLAGTYNVLSRDERGNKLTGLGMGNRIMGYFENNYLDSVVYFSGTSNVHYSKTYSWNNDDLIWMDNQFELYDEDLNLIEYYSKGWNRYENDYGYGIRTVRQFENGLRISFYVYHYEPENGTWEPDERVMHIYNEYGKNTLSLSQRWHSGTGTWINTDKTESFFDEAMNVVDSYRSEWDGVSQSWIYQSYFHYLYNEDNLLDTFTVSLWNNLENKWDFYQKWLISYNASGQVVERLIMLFDEQFEEWINDMKLVYMFEELQTETTRYEWDTINGFWIPDYRNTSSHTADSTSFTRQYDNWDSLSQQWEPSSRIIINYDVRLNQTGILFQIWDNTTEIWITMQQNDYFWSPFKPLDVNEFEITEFKVYPNPAGDFVTFAYTLPPGTTGGSIEIHNLTGQRVAAIPLNLAEDKVLFDIRELPPGIYFYTLKTARAATTAKLVVTR